MLTINQIDEAIRLMERFLRDARERKDFNEAWTYDFAIKTLQANYERVIGTTKNGQETARRIIDLVQTSEGNPCTTNTISVEPGSNVEKYS